MMLGERNVEEKGQKLIGRTAALVALMLTVTTCAFAGGHAKFFQYQGEDVKPLRTPIYWTFACDFPEELKAPVREGFKYWDDKTSRELFKESSCLRINRVTGIVVTTSQDYYTNDKGKQKKSIWGTANNANISGYALIGSTITLYRPWLEAKDDQWTRISVVRHEVGHALGFDHVDDEECLMYPYINTPHKTYSDKHIYKEACPAEVRKFREKYDDALPRKTQAR